MHFSEVRHALLLHNIKIKSDIGKWLFMIFGLPFIPHEEIEDTFVEVVMSEAHVDARCTKFADYLADNYVTQESRFPPFL
jgi:hypothetical protein